MQTIKSLAFTQEGTSVVFKPTNGNTGHDIGKQHFEGCCEFEATMDECIVRTQSLQEMGFGLEMGPQTPADFDRGLADCREGRTMSTEEVIGTGA